MYKLNYIFYIGTYNPIRFSVLVRMHINIITTLANSITKRTNYEVNNYFQTNCSTPQQHCTNKLLIFDLNGFSNYSFDRNL